MIILGGKVNKYHFIDKIQDEKPLIKLLNVRINMFRKEGKVGNVKQKTNKLA